MSQDSGQWPPQGQPDRGDPYQPPGSAGYPPSAPPAGYPTTPSPTGGYPPQPSSGGYPPPSSPGGYPPQGAYNPQAPYYPQGGYAPQQPGVPPAGGGGYLPPGPGGGGLGGPATKKSPAMIIGIVAAAVVLLAAIGGIILVLNRGDDAQPGSTITPGTPTTEPTTEPSGEPSSTPSSRPGSSATTTPQPTASPTEPPSGEAIDLGLDISLTPGEGYELEKSGNGYARLSNGNELFLGQAVQVDAGTNPGQLCEAWHRKIAEGQANGKFSDPKTTDLGTKKLKGATCVGTFTASNGSGSSDIFVFSLVSVRTDGVTVLGTMYFLKGADTDQLNSDFSTMVNSMLQSQAV